MIYVLLLEFYIIRINNRTPSNVVFFSADFVMFVGINGFLVIKTRSVSGV